MGPVESAIREGVKAGDALRTPSRGAAFRIARLDDNALVLLLGKKAAWTPIRWTCLEGIPELLRGQVWVLIGSRYETAGKPGTLDGYLKTCLKRATAGWVAVVLEQAGVVEIERDPPARVRLAAGFGST